MHTRWVRMAVASAGLGCAAAHTAADVVLTSQEREMLVTAKTTADTRGDTAIGFFTEDIAVSALNPGGAPADTAHAFQDSVIRTDLLRVTGIAEAALGTPTGGFAAASNLFQSLFTVTGSDTPWRLDASWEYEGSIAPDFLVVLRGDQGVLFQDTTLSAAEMHSLSGVLAPGNYEMKVFVQIGQVGAGVVRSGRAEFDVALTIPAPASAGALGIAGLMLPRRRR